MTTRSRRSFLKDPLLSAKTASNKGTKAVSTEAAHLDAWTPKFRKGSSSVAPRESRFLKYVRAQNQSDDDVPARYKPGDHGDVTQRAWLNFWKQGTLCDVTLVMGEKRVRAHRAMLALHSPYFLAMFTTELMENKSSEVDLSESVDDEALEALVNFMYTGELLVFERTAQDLMTSASFLQMHKILDFCSDFLKTKIVAENCLGFKAFAQHLNLRELFLTCRHFAEENFCDVIEAEEFHEMPFEVIADLIKSEKLKVPTEVVVYKAVTSWVEFDVCERQPFLALLLKDVRLSLMPREVLNKIFQESHIQEDPTCYDLVREVRRSTLSKESSKGTDVETKERPRRADESNKAILVMSPGMPATLECYNILDSIWTSKGTIYPEDVVGVVSDDEVVYAVGGSGVATFDAARNKWNASTSTKTMRDARNAHCVVGLEGRIYAIGGTPLGFVEIFDPLRDRWDAASPTILPREFAAAAAFNGSIYLAGGMQPNRFLKTVEKYDPKLDSWTSVAEMNERRAGHALCACGGNLYAIGGWNDEAVLPSVERFNPLTNAWVQIAPLNQPRKHVAAVEHQGLIYAVGGRQERNLSTVERFDPRRDVWTQLPIKMTIARDQPTACIVDRPRWAM